MYETLQSNDKNSTVAFFVKVFGTPAAVLSDGQAAAGGQSCVQTLEGRAEIRRDDSFCAACSKQIPLRSSPSHPRQTEPLQWRRRSDLWNARRAEFWKCFRTRLSDIRVDRVRNRIGDDALARSSP